MIANRDTLPSDPGHGIRLAMLVSFMASNNFDPDDEICLALADEMRAGHFVYWPEGRMQMTKEGFDFLDAQTEHANTTMERYFA